MNRADHLTIQRMTDRISRLIGGILLLVLPLASCTSSPDEPMGLGHISAAEARSIHQNMAVSEWSSAVPMATHAVVRQGHKDFEDVQRLVCERTRRVEKKARAWYKEWCKTSDEEFDQMRGRIIREHYYKATLGSSYPIR